MEDFMWLAITWVAMFFFGWTAHALAMGILRFYYRGS